MVALEPYVDNAIAAVEPTFPTNTVPSTSVIFLAPESTVLIRYNVLPNKPLTSVAMEDSTKSATLNPATVSKVIVLALVSTEIQLYTTSVVRPTRSTLYALFEARCVLICKAVLVKLDPVTEACTPKAGKVVERVDTYPKSVVIAERPPAVTVAPPATMLKPPVNNVPPPASTYMPPSCTVKLPFPPTRVI